MKKDKNNYNGSDAAQSPDAQEEPLMAEVMDNVPEADDENLSAEDIENDEMNQINELARQLGEEKAKVEKEKKEYLFLMAEFDNFRKRTLREKQDLIRNASEKVLQGLLPIVDDFERGLAATKDTDDADSVRQGMELIYNKLMKYLEQNGVTPIESTGAPFDPELHDALTSIPATDDSQRGKVVDTPTRGYMLNDKVLRHAKVVVAQ